MLQRNLILFFRNIKRDKTSFLINLVGLSTGLACAILIYLWVNDELNVDKFHEKDSQLYQVMNNKPYSDGIRTRDYTPAFLAKALAEEMPDVEYAVPINTFPSWHSRDGVLSDGDNHLKARGIFAGKDYFNVFSSNLVHGDKNQALADKNGIIISERLAKKMFKTTKNIIGRNLDWEHEIFKGAFHISGIFENLPSSSSLQFDLIFNYGVLLDNYPDANRWTGNYADTYLILRENVDIAHFNDKIAGFLGSKYPGGEKSTLFVQQYSKRYLHGNYENGIQSGGKIEYVRLFSIIALFILIIACINFMNLSTAKASKRVKEVGVKKAIGLNRKTLVLQFLGESMLMAFLSSVIAVLLVVLFLPMFNEITGKQLHLGIGASVILSVIVIILLTGFISGSYPAFYLSKFDPATVLKGKLKSTLGELWIRKGLVIFQFTLSVVFIVGFLVIYKQIEYTQTKNLGYNRENVICFREDQINDNAIKTFISELENIPGVVSASNMYASILGGFGMSSHFFWEGKDPNEKIMFPTPRVGYDCIETLGIEMKDGRSFSLDYSNERSKLILNEAAVKMIGFKNPIGESINCFWGDMQIIGVVKDFHCGSIQENVKPLFFRFDSEGRDFIIRIKAGAEVVTLERLKKFYEKSHPGYPFEFTFMDDDYQALYESENKVAVLSKYFSAIAIIISCLGLFGLAAFTVERRRKEIGIRKVHGSSGFGIMKLVSSDFSKIVLISITISLPISYLIMKNWLDGFAYRIALSWWFFAGAGLIALLVALLTVGSQALKASNINPAVCLKDE